MQASSVLVVTTTTPLANRPTTRRNVAMSGSSICIASLCRHYGPGGCRIPASIIGVALARSLNHPSLAAEVRPMTDTLKQPATATPGTTDGSRPHSLLVADIIIANAPDPVFVSDLEGKILQANDAVSELLGFRKDEVVEQSLSRFISPEETREFTAALREVVERGVTRNARLNPRSASGEVIPTTLNASALRDLDGKVIGAIGILRDMRAYEQVVRDLEQSKAELQEKILDLEKFEEVVVGRELKMIALEKDLELLRAENEKLRR